MRDIKERGRSIKSVLIQYNTFVKKAYDEFVKPTMKYADIIIPYGRKNQVAIQFVVDNIRMCLIEAEEAGESLLSISECETLKKSMNLTTCTEDIKDVNLILGKIVSDQGSEYKK